MIKYKTTGNDESEKENFCCMTNEKDRSCATPYKTMIGGQALIEGIMMLGPEKKAVVVRKPDGELVEQVDAMEDVKEMALAYHDQIVPAMAALRKPVDEMELLVDKSIWPVPTYGDLMFEV